MLHKNAKTCFILQQLTRVIFVNFSIRQGDPLSMILYIIYMEPFLLYLDRHLIGLHLSDIPPAVHTLSSQTVMLATPQSVPEAVEAFCDDVTLLQTTYKI